MASSGVTDTGAGEIVTITIRGDTALGIVVDADKDGSAAIIRGWDRLPNGKFGPIQKHGGIHIGDALISVNDISLINMPFSEVKALLKDTNIINKTLKFCNSSEHYSKKRTMGIESAIATKDSMKVNFLSIIKQARVSEDSKKKFAEYEVACSLRVPTSIQRDRIVRWSIWKRYSDFEALDQALRRELGWQMDSIEFPSSHSLAFNKLSVGFIEQRRLDLNTYWEQILVIDKVVDFSKHHCSADLKAFLNVDAEVAKSSSKQSDGGESSELAASEDSATAEEGRAAPGQVKRQSSRRQSLQAGNRRTLQRQPSDPSSVSTPSLSPAATVPQTSPEPPAKVSPPIPPPPPRSAVAAAPVAAAPAPTAKAATSSTAPVSPEAIATGKLPPKASGARANLLGDIAKLRKN